MMLIVDFGFRNGGKKRVLAGRMFNFDAEIWREEYNSTQKFGGKNVTFKFDADFWREECNFKFDADFWREVWDRHHHHHLSPPTTTSMSMR
jgi:hypothetical protein